MRVAGIDLRDSQVEAIRMMHTGCILAGDTGSGKSRAALAYYYLFNNLLLDKLVAGEPVPEEYVPMRKFFGNWCDLYIITTAKKRDSLEWNDEMRPFHLHPIEEIEYKGLKIVVDSWNNIKNYIDVTSSFFIFDEQRLVGKGVWVKSFLKIAKHNQWVLLSATPGDNWEDYSAVFIANNFYKNYKEYFDQHFEYDPWTNYPKIKRYHNLDRLVRLRKKILIPMYDERDTKQEHFDIPVEYDIVLYNNTRKNRWNYQENKPIETAAMLCYQLRKIVNSDSSRVDALCNIREKNPRIIVFYNYDYELDILVHVCIDLDIPFAEWNGHAHQPIPDTEEWIYIVQYAAGSEAWNCIKTNCIVFFSENYSYKIMHQAAGRIDRLNTPYKTLYYYHLKSRSSIDIAIDSAIKRKKKFNESNFVGKFVNARDIHPV